MTSARDDAFVRSAIEAASSALGCTWPNPAVGCILVDPCGRELSRGVTQPGGRPHAEAVALQEAGALAAGATAYVTLEPCAHHGKTPPCADALIDAGVARVVIALLDEDPRVAGAGVGKLRSAGLLVEVGVHGALAELAARNVEGFFHRLRTGLPLVLDASDSRTSDGILACSEGSWVCVLAHARETADLLELRCATLDEALRELGEHGLTSVRLDASLAPFLTVGSSHERGTAPSRRG